MTASSKSIAGPNEFYGKRVLVTGVTKGTGKAIAGRFKQGGATVIINSRSALDEKTDHHFIQADVSTPDGTTKVINEILNRFYGIDIIVHNVGGSSVPSGSFITFTDEIWQQNINEKLFPAVRLDRGLLPSTIAQRSSVIIHISSIQSTLPLDDSTLAYAAAKAALTNYSKDLANEVSPKGIRVNTVSPGFIETDAARKMIERMADTDKTNYATTRQIPMDMLGELVAFLGSDRASAITGSEYVIDGGRSRRSEKRLRRSICNHSFGSLPGCRVGSVWNSLIGQQRLRLGERWRSPRTSIRRPVQ